MKAQNTNAPLQTAAPLSPVRYTQAAIADRRSNILTAKKIVYISSNTECLLQTFFSPAQCTVCTAQRTLCLTRSGCEATQSSIASTPSPIVFMPADARRYQSFLRQQKIRLHCRQVILRCEQHNLSATLHPLRCAHYRLRCRHPGMRCLRGSLHALPVIGRRHLHPIFYQNLISNLSLKLNSKHNV
jgi:hypothetical protein